MRELLTSDSASQWEQPLAHNEEDEDDLVKGQDPHIGTDRCKHVLEHLWREANESKVLLHNKIGCSCYGSIFAIFFSFFYRKVVI